ncbi:MAG: hypothetical protein F9K34_17770 [Albidovulum sp.]|uniref:hypothetical protein n=1 Tax=Albidovulum sp. TaxID=1872424 RepID=UPI00132C2301|nr:hypothetical protein [Defluviimonas sp.]KAB2878430.1 MAG: hypothetical protein F9K34_17770 [Defluviimonas sp.]
MPNQRPTTSGGAARATRATETPSRLLAVLAAFRAGSKLSATLAKRVRTLDAHRPYNGAEANPVTTSPSLLPRLRLEHLLLVLCTAFLLFVALRPHLFAELAGFLLGRR